jgi:plasmid stabilization system protein ParE
MPAGAIKRIIFAAEAADDIASAYRWHEEREIGLGEEFLRAIAASISLILRQPELYPIALDNFRRAILRRFPYEIFYEVAEKNLIVHAVFNCSQDPERWKRRLGNS